jgi:hypothetical protein
MNNASRREILDAKIKRLHEEGRRLMEIEANRPLEQKLMREILVAMYYINLDYDKEN